MLLKNIKINSIKNEKLKDKIIAHLDNLTKPKKSLGVLEDISIRYYLIKGEIVKHKSQIVELYTFAGDHGITEENITPYPSEVTKQMVINMLKGGAAVSVMCKKAGIKSYVVDMGVKSDFKDLKTLISRKIKKGTNNFKIMPAMSKEECSDAINVGISLAENSNADILGIGEMGIGNSSSASAIYSLLLGINAEDTVGIGTGSFNDLYNKKLTVIKEALVLHAKEWDKTGFDALRRLGGYETAGMTGMILGAAKKRIPVVVDGFIAGSAALAAIKINENVKDYLFFSHISKEKFHKKFCEIINVRPILDLDMCLGEGTGSVLAIQIIQQALAVFNEMATFDSAKVSNQI